MSGDRHGAASQTQQEVAWKLDKHPEAGAEDMESYSVAMACQLQNTPLTVVRGISNHAGVRDHTQWKIDEALAAVAEMAAVIMSDR